MSENFSYSVSLQITGNNWLAQDVNQDPVLNTKEADAAHGMGWGPNYMWRIRNRF